MFIYNPASYNSPWHIHVARVVAVLLFLTGFWLFGSDYYFIKTSSVIAGTVLYTDYSRSLNFGHNQYSHPDSYDVNYQFSVDGKNYSGRGNIDYDPGKTVTVYYNHFDPANNRLDEPDTSIPRNMTILGALFTLGLFPWKWLRKSKENSKK
jgi:hypothetical protein